MSVSTAHIRTENAGSYLRKLCQHWSHRFAVEYHAEQGSIQMPEATVVLEASPDLLTVKLDVKEGADESRLREVVQEHLQRFGFREELVFHWEPKLA